MRVWEDDRGARGIVGFRVQIRAGLLVAAVLFLVSGAACSSAQLGITSSVGFDLGDWEFWLIAVAAALSFTALVMVLAEPASALETVSSESTASANRSDSPVTVGRVFGILFVMIIVSSLLLRISSGPYLVGFFVHVAFLIIIIPLAPIALSGKNGRVMASVFAIMASTIGMVYYMEGPGLLDPLISFGGGVLGLGLAALVGAASYMELRRGLFVASFFDGGMLPVIAAAVGGMLALIALSFFLWVQLGIHLGAAMFSAIGSMSLTAFILWKYLKGRMPTNP